LPASAGSCSQVVHPAPHGAAPARWQCHQRRHQGLQHHTSLHACTAPELPLLPRRLLHAHTRPGKYSLRTRRRRMCRRMWLPVLPSLPHPPPGSAAPTFTVRTAPLPTAGVAVVAAHKVHQVHPPQRESLHARNRSAQAAGCRPPPHTHRSPPFLLAPPRPALHLRLNTQRLCQCEGLHMSGSRHAGLYAWPARKAFCKGCHPYGW
jgi:hypothetical protein